MATAANQETRGYVLVPQGWKATHTLTQDEWERIGRSLARGLDNWHWVVGDWIVYGEDVLGPTILASTHHPGQSKYDKLMVLTGLSIETLQLCAKVSRSYPIDERVITASWTRHLEALCFPENVRWTLLREPLTSTEWRDLLDRHRVKNTSEAKPKPVIECPKCGHTWRP